MKSKSIKLLSVLSLSFFLSLSFVNAQSTTSVATSSDTLVKMHLYTKENFSGTEHALVLEKSNIKKIENDEHKNELSSLTSVQINLIQNTLKNLKQNSIPVLVINTDPQIIKILGKATVTSKFKTDAKYFKNYKLNNFNLGYVVTTIDESLMVLGDFKEVSGESKMFGIVLSKYNNKYYINSILPGETAIVFASKDNPSLDPITIPNPMKGFLSKNLNEVGGYILVPDKWYFRYEENNGTQAYFISQQEIKKDTDIFETGLTMNVVYQYLIPGQDAVKYIDTHINNVSKNRKIEKTSSKEVGDYFYKEIIRTFSEGKDKYKMAVRVIANKKTNTLYVISFESTLKSWNTNWTTKGKVMLDYLSLSR